MKRKICFKSALMILLCLSLSGCADDEILEEIPRDFTVVSSPLGERKEEEPSDNSEVEKDISGEKAERAEDAGFLREDAFEYARWNLNETEQLWYDDIKKILGTYSREIRLNEAGLTAGYDETDIDRIFQYVLNDHPELFYVEGYSYTKYTRGEKTTAIEFSGTYSVDRENAESRYEAIEAAADEILSGLDANADQYTKVKYVYDTIIRNTDYELSAPDKIGRAHV